MNIDEVSISFVNVDGTAVEMWTRRINVRWQVGVAIGIVKSYPVLHQPISIGGIDTASYL